MKLGNVVRLGLIAVVSMSLANERADASVICSEADAVPIGEMRYKAVSGADEAYANAYMDGGQELTLPSSGPAACFNGSSSFSSYAYLEDTSTDCSATTFEMTLYWSNSVSSGCPTSPSVLHHTYVVDRCSSPYASSDVVYAGLALRSTTNNTFYQYWKGVLTVSGAESEVSDEACWSLINVN